jgi:hypothetical protein
MTTFTFIWGLMRDSTYAVYFLKNESSKGQLNFCGYEGTEVLMRSLRTERLL